MSKSRALSFAIALSLGSMALAEARADDAAALQPTPLPRVTVTAEHESDGYQAERSRSATKTDTPLLDVPQSVSVVTRDLILDQSMQSLADVVRYVPGAGMAQGEGNRDAIILRGNSSTSDFFVDGVRDDVEYFRDLYNLDRIEVLKGPNAMIFGRGGAGGVVNRVTRQANWSAERELSLQGGSWDNLRATFDLGDGLTESFAARITGLYEDSDSYRDGVRLERKGVNPTMAWSLGDATVLRFSYEYYDYDRIADRGIPSLDGRPFQTDESTFFGDQAQSPTHTTVNQGSIVVDHAFNDYVTIRNRTMYADYDKFYQNVFPGAVDALAGTVAITAYNAQQLRENLFNQTDLNFALDTGRIHHGFLAGVELGEQVTDNFRNTGYFNDVDTSVQAPLDDPTISVPLTFRQSATDADNHGRATIAAVYVQDQIRFSPKFEAVLGLRFDKFDMDFTNNRTGENLESSDDLLSPRAGLIYKPIEPMSLYASYSMTHVPRAGAQLTSLNVTNQALDPEEFENVEVGAKWDVRPGLALTAALFQLDRTNVVIPDADDPSVSILVDGQRTKGFEFGASGQISEAWGIQGGYAYQDGELTEALGGNRLAQLPKHVASLWNRYDLTPAWGVGLGIVHQTEMFAAADSAVTLPEFTRVDAAVFYTPSDRLKMQLNVENLLDEQYYPNAHNNNNITPGSPLALRVGVTASF
ncbi:MAG TPA: TonB-dependent siderophore receptor [Steroidobacteraceae bacterium]